ncbi:hydrogen peroxide-inducible genes activator [Lentisphaera profundi]|uniref:Hydrogen peroxide-inducible genes activator n=1 Tax=Lentisphaera profundi TaxID=1658616 RepID=A0ABY7VWI2_9BACT|nr:hydrogen peroxide-inducible genes activator [Lentisphaera profundi]WDE98447.1 hydrogen peroxide-inducible genes activator [Lentisphaera profundi]
MTLKDLEYFAILAKLRHFGRAALEAGVSQPALSIQIKKLEAELGLCLFERSNKQVVLSPEGAHLLQRAENIIQQVSDFRTCAKSFKDPYQGHLILGAFPTLAPYLFPQILDELHQSYPEMKFFIKEEKTEQLLEMLKQGKVDAAFIALPHEDKLLESEFIFSEDFLFAVPANYPERFPSHLSVADLKGRELMLLDEGHCFRDQALEFCTVNQLQERFDFRASSLETLRQMVAAGLGLTLLPQCAKNESDKIRYIDFEDPAPQRSIALFWRKSSAKAEIFREIADDLKRVLTHA